MAPPSDGSTAISITVTIVGEGAVRINDQIACSSINDPCTLTVAIGSTTTVAADPALGYQFQSWSCMGQISTNPTLDLTLQSGAQCTVTFAKESETLMVNVTDGRGGTGGVVTSSPAGIACGTGQTMCSAALEWGTAATLTATADPFYTFVGWEGDCSGTEPILAVSISKPVSCTARFAHVQNPLTVIVVGEGVVHATGGAPAAALLDCSTGTCGPVDVDSPTVVTLDAAPALNWRLSSWSGDCTATPELSSTTVTMDAARTCTVTFALVDRLLVTQAEGGGAITRSPLGTETSDGASYTHGATVELTAIPDENKIFIGWSGDCGGTEAMTTVTMDADKQCKATFAPTPRTLVVSVVGPGSVTSAPSGIDTAANDGVEVYDHGTSITLTAKPAANYEVAGWTGDCSGTALEATVLMEGDRSCVVTFQLVKHPLVVTVLGSGSVTSAPVGIDTTVGAYEALYDYDTDVTLTATPNTGSLQISFLKWSGDCASFGSNPIATVDLTTARACTAEFTITPYDLTVAVAPSGGGNVLGQKNGTGSNVIDCGTGSDCGETAIPSNENVVLAATPASGYRFDAWSGCSTSTSPTLTVPMNANKSCTANFVKQWRLRVSRVVSNGVTTLDPGAIAGQGIDCGADCARNGIDADQTVALTVSSQPGFVFTGWSGTAVGCSGSATTVTVGTGGNAGAIYTCDATWDQTARVVAAVAPSAVGTATGQGTVIVGGASVGTTVTLTRPADSGSYQFTGWSGSFTTGSGTATGCSGTGATATVGITSASADAIYTCTATYNTLWNLTVSKSLTNGSTSVDPGAITGGGVISCGSDCSESGLGSTATVTLTAPQPAGFTWKGWSGTAPGCSGTAATITVSYGGTPGTTYTCNASWDELGTVVGAASPSAVGSVTGGGTVIVGPTGSPGTTVTLSRPANSGSYQLAAWSGSFTTGSGTATGCSGTGANVTVAITSATAGAVYTCTASYTTLWNLTVGKSLTSGAAPTGGLDPGAVTGGGVINCGGDCAESGLGSTATVTLTAPTSVAGFVWKGWSGTASGCSGTSASVTVGYGGSAGATYSCDASWDQVATVAGAASPGAVGSVTGGGSVLVGPTGTPGTTVTLSKPANNGSYQFTGWSGSFTTGSGTATGCTGTGATATVAITSASAGAVYTCTATYNTLWNLSVSRSLSSGAAITSGLDPGAVTGAGISCGSDCSETGLVSTATVTLSAPAGGSFAFRQWSGTAPGCTGSSPTVTVSYGGTPGTTYTCNAEWDQTVSVLATASPSAAGAPTGAGVVIVGGSGATLTRAANSGSYAFVGWSGSFTTGTGTATGCTGNAASTTVAISSASAGAVYTCTATYNTLWNLTVGKSLTNGATISASLDPGAVTGAGISCGTDCGETGLVSTATVTLTAPAPAGFVWKGWSGTAPGCSGTTASVTVSYGGTPGTTYTCNASWDEVASVVGTASPSAAGTVTGGGTVVVGSGSVGTITTLTRPASSGSYTFTSWSGSFTTGSGTVAAGSCSGVGASTTVQITSSSPGAVYTCIANYGSLWNLTVSKSLTNGAALDPGTISGPGIACGADCSENGLATTATVALSATNVPSGGGFTFVGWSGTAPGCSGATSSVTVSYGGTPGATYTCDALWAQTAAVVGAASPSAVGSVTGGGTVTVGPPGVATTVTLIKPANSGSYAFTGWSGSFTTGSGTATGCTSNGPSATVTITSATAGAVYTCTANYSTLWNLTVGKSITNGAAVDPGAITGAGISCGADCGETGLASTTTVTLTAPQPAGYTWKGWSGTATGCSGSATSVTVSYGGTPGTTYTCNAAWDENATVVGVANPSGAGTVTGGGGVIVGGAGVLLNRPAPSASYAFTGWSGAFTSGSGTATGCTGATASVTVAITSATPGAVYTCTASYNTLWNLSVQKTLTNGSTTVNPGTVTGTSSSATIVSCGADCGETGLLSTATATLTAPNVPTGGGFTFVGWSGTAPGCSGTGASVTVSFGGTAGATYTCNPTWDQTARVLGAASPSAVGTVSVTSGGVVTVGGSGVGTTVTVSKPADSGSYRFTGWSGSFTSGSGTVVAGSCSGAAATTTVTITSATANAQYTCTASYDTLWNLSVSKSLTNGAGLDPGAVTGTGISCGADCGETGLTSTTSITLTAPTPAGYTFKGWTGTASGCTGTTASVTVSYAGTPGTTYTCNPSWDQNATVTGVASASGGTSGVTPASTTVVVGGSGIGTIVTIDRGTVQTLWRFSGWSGSFTVGSGTVAAGSCSGTAQTTTVQVTSASVGATYRCVANFVQRGTVNVSPGTGGSATVSSSAAAPNNCAAGSSCTVDGGIVTSLSASPSAGYRFNSWSGATCSVASTTSASTTLTVTAGTTHSCTANFTRTYKVNVRIVPAPTSATSFGTVSAPCAIGSSGSACSSTVDTGSTISMSAAENIAPSGLRSSRFVRWQCVNATTNATVLNTTSMTSSIGGVTADLNCVAQFYGLWARYYRSSTSVLNLAPSAVDLPLAVSTTDGLVNSSAHFLIDSASTGGGAASDALIAADTEVNFPALANRALPSVGYSTLRLLSDGNDQVTALGRHTLASGFRAAFWPYTLSRNATTGIENALGREIFTEYGFTAPPPTGQISYSYDSTFASGVYATSGFATAGTKTLNVTYNFGSGQTTQSQGGGWAMLTNLVGTAARSTRWLIPTDYTNSVCGTGVETTALDVMWDPDPANPGGIVVVGNYTPATSTTYSYVVKLSSTLTLVAPGIRTFVPSGGANLTGARIVKNLAGNGYAIFGVFGGVNVSMIDLPYNLTGFPPVDDGFFVIDAQGGNMNTTLGDVLVEGSRYVVLATGNNLGQSDLYAIFINGAGVVQGGIEFGTTTLSEAAWRIVKPRDGGYLLTGHGYLATDPIQFAAWTARTDENFFVPWNGNAPTNRQNSMLASRFGKSDLKLTGGTFNCAASWFDTQMPTANTVSEAGASFNATVNIQAP